MTVRVRVYVKDAPGLEDFWADYLKSRPAVDARGKLALVQTVVDGRTLYHVVPYDCLTIPSSATQ